MIFSFTRWLRSLSVLLLLTSLTWAADETKPGKATAPAGNATTPAAEAAKGEGKETAAPVAVKPNDEAPGTEPEEDEERAAEKKEAEDSVKVARPVSADPVQVFGWREKVKVGEMTDTMVAKLDTGALTSSLHAENQQLFERDGKKWVKFVLTDPGQAGAKRYDIEAPLARTVLIKEPGGQSERRNVVRLNFQIGERSIKAEFTLNNRDNMICPVLIGRSTIQVLGWVDPSRTYLADDKIFR
jgi:hypothetical protein